MQGAFLVIFTLLWTAGVMFFNGFAARNIAKQYKSGSYPMAAGTVTHSEVQSHRGSKGGTSYTAVINYRFLVGEQAFAGSRLRYNVISGGWSQANSLVAAHPTGAAVDVFYDPANPQEALLYPGISGADFMTVLFLTPFNALMLGFWIGAGAWLRERLARPVAGGVKIMTDGIYTRVRLPRFGPVGWALVTTGGLGFASIFIVGFGTQMQPSVALVLTVISTIYLAGVAVGFWHWQKLQTGVDDLVINAAGGSLELPQTFGRKERLTVSFADIEDFSVAQIVHRSSKGGITYTYAPTLRLRGPQAGEQKLAEWSDKVKADDFAAWLRPQLGRLHPEEIVS
jgi:hypothetical protein